MESLPSSRLSPANTPENIVITCAFAATWGEKGNRLGVCLAKIGFLGNLMQSLRRPKLPLEERSGALLGGSVDEIFQDKEAAQACSLPSWNHKATGTCEDVPGGNNGYVPQHGLSIADLVYELRWLKKQKPWKGTSTCQVLTLRQKLLLLHLHLWNGDDDKIMATSLCWWRIKESHGIT